jgi:FAD synthase
LYNCELVVGFDFNFGFGGEQKLWTKLPYSRNFPDPKTRGRTITQ